MAGAWVSSGRLVVKKPRSADYGVELAAVPDGERIQVRLVGAANSLEPRSTARDKNAEVEWCAEFDQLQKTASSAGIDLLIERANPAGTVPVKDVFMEDLDAQRRANKTKPIERRQS
jgi:hypothetical protein